MKKVSIGPRSINHGNTGQTTIGTTAGQLSTNTRSLAGGRILIKAHAANTGFIYVGFVPGVATTTGYQLDAGEEVEVPAASESIIYIIGSAAGQVVSYLSH